MNPTKEYDITLYGATGFTGKLAAKSLDQECQKHGLRLALAGRNRKKLEAVASQLSGKSKVGIIVAESSDQKALDQLTRQTKVVVNTAGPFAKYAPILIASCVDHQCDYVDITGEAPFIRQMIDRHHETAKANGVRIVPFCGFDSIPSDMGRYFVLREWRKKFKKTNEACIEIISLFQMKGGLNGGTAHSAIQMSREGSVKILNEDLRLLCPPGLPLPPAKPDWKLPRKVKGVNGFAAPFFMAPINTRVVRRSQALFALEESEKTFSPTLPISYEEGMLVNEPLPILSSLVSGVLWTVDVLGRSKTLLSLAEKMVPQPGEGPSEKTMATGFTKVTYVARGENGSLMKARFEAPGDPGNRATIAMLTQAALCLALDDERKKLPDVSGVLTPAFAFRDVLVDRLIGNGVTFEVIS